MTAWWFAARERMASWVLGSDRLQRIYTAGTLMAAGFYAVSAALELSGMTGDLGDPLYDAHPTVYMLAGPVLFYGVLRSRWSRLWRPRSKMLAQALYAIVALTLSYPAHSAVRGLNLVVLCLLPLLAIGVLSPRGIRWLGAVGLLSMGTMIGYLGMYHPDQFDPNLELIHFFLVAAVVPAVAHVAATVSGLRLEQRQQGRALEAALARLEQSATRDELTGLINRSHMGVRLADEEQRARRQGLPMCICLIDIDHFKRINDQHGHAVGDRVLQRFALRCTAVLRDIDVLARWGGEEFLLLLPTTSLAAADSVLTRLRLAHRMSDDDHPIDHDGDDPLPAVTCSAGLALHSPDADLQATIARADAALYRAKAAGRDRVELAPAGPAPQSHGTPSLG